MPTLYDADGNPIDKTRLVEEVAAPTVTGVRQILSGHPAAFRLKCTHQENHLIRAKRSVKQMIFRINTTSERLLQEWNFASVKPFF